MRLKRVGSVIKLKPDNVEEYKELHANAWEPVLEQIKKSNIQNYSIFYKDGFLFSYYEYVGDNYDEDMKRMSEDEWTKKWWDVCMPCQEPLDTRDEDEWWAEMEEFFYLR